MIFFIPHKTEQLSLAKAQKEIVAELNKMSSAYEHDNTINNGGKNHDFYFPEFPLWINFNSRKQNLEKIFDSNFFKNKNEKLKSMRKNLNPIFLYEFQQKNGELFFPAIWNYGEEKFLGKIVFGKKRNVQAEENISYLKSLKKSFPENKRENDGRDSMVEFENFNLQTFITCKIFQVALAEFSISEKGVKSWQVLDSVWIKIC